MELSTSASALGLYKYDCDRPESGLFNRFYSIIIDQLHSWGISPTYVGAEGDGYSGEYKKIGSRAHEKLMKSSFSGVTSLSLATNPPGSDEPSYDSFVTASLNYVDVNRELLACIVVNEALLVLRSLEYDDLLRSLVQLCEWDFGYGFTSSVDKQPDFHILGLDNGKLSAEEYESLCVWYDAPGKVRAALLRDVYPYNLLNDTQLNTPLGNGETLRQFAQRQPGCVLTDGPERGVSLWQVPNAELARIRMTLHGSPVVMR